MKTQDESKLAELTIQLDEEKNKLAKREAELTELREIKSLEVIVPPRRRNYKTPTFTPRLSNRNSGIKLDTNQAVKTVEKEIEFIKYNIDKLINQIKELGGLSTRINVELALQLRDALKTREQNLSSTQVSNEERMSVNSRRSSLGNS